MRNSEVDLRGIPGYMYVGNAWLIILEISIERWFVMSLEY